MNLIISTVILCAFLVGFGYWWGTANAERLHREQRVKMEVGRILVSMPVNADQGSKTLQMVSELMRQVEEQDAANGEVNR